MIIEIHGAGFRNKGAFLMMKTVMARLSGKYPDAKFVIDPFEVDDMWGHAPVPILNVFSVEPLFPKWLLRPWLRRLSLLLGPLVHRRILELYRFVSRHNVDCFVDISGFRFGDNWENVHRDIENITVLTKYYKKRNVPVVFLPQMIGELSGLNSESFLRLLRTVNLFCARDNSSFKIVKEFDECSEKLRIYPDITISHAMVGATALDEKVECEGAVIVLNEKVYKYGKYISGEDYLKTMARLFSDLSKSYRVKLLVHETYGGDLSLAETILKNLNVEDNGVIIGENDPVIIKKILGTQALVVSSRFHACVGALSAGVVTAGIGWAHKYDELFLDFGVGDMVWKPDDDYVSFYSRLENVLGRSSEVRRTIQGNGVKMAGDLEAMWTEVYDMIDSSSGIGGSR